MNKAKMHTVSMIHQLRKLAGAVLPQNTVRWDVPYLEMKDTPRIVVLSEYANATYFATFHYPLRYLQSRGLVDFAMLSGAGVDRCLAGLQPDTFVKRLVSSVAPHGVIFSRYVSPFAKELLESFQSLRVTTLYHTDDDLLNLPDTLGSGVLSVHGAAEVLATRRFCMTHVDGILASTSHLATSLRAQFPSQQVTELVYPPYLPFLIKKRHRKSDRPDSKQVTIGYMGSRGHQRDLQMIVPSVAHILNTFPQARFETFGTVTIPNSLRCFGDRVVAHAPRRSYEEFLQTQYDLDWDIGLAPLEDNEFNRCRSPIKFLEYTACDIVTVASNVMVYRSVIGSDAGVVTADHDWGTVLERLIVDVEWRRTCLDRARSVCTERFHLQHVSAKLAETLHISQRDLGEQRC